MAGRVGKGCGKKELGRQLGLFDPVVVDGRGGGTEQRQEKPEPAGMPPTAPPNRSGPSERSVKMGGMRGLGWVKLPGAKAPFPASLVVMTADRSPRVESRRIELPTFEQRLIMLLDMDAFFASAEQVARPALKGKPVIVGGLVTDRSVVASASYEARALGVKTAMPIAQAQRICPQGVFLRGNYEMYSSLSKKVMEICNTVTPLVQQASIDEAYMDLTGTQRLYATAGAPAGARPMAPKAEARNWPVGLAERLLGTIRRETGLGATIGIGSNKLVARMAMEHAKPGGVCFVWPGYEAAFLAMCPLADIPGIGRQTAAMLADYNLRTAADVQKTGRELLVVTFGERFGQMLYDCAWGRGSAHLDLAYAQKSISRATSFERDTTDMGYIKSMLYYLTERACRALRQMGQAAWTVSVKLRYSDFATVDKARTLGEPSNHDDIVYKAAEELLENLYSRAVSVRLVGVQLSGFTGADQVQLQMWQPEQVRHGRLYEMSDRIRDRYGFCALMKGPTIELMGKMEQDAAGLKLRTACLTK